MALAPTTILLPAGEDVIYHDKGPCREAPVLTALVHNAEGFCFGVGLRGPNIGICFRDGRPASVRTLRKLLGTTEHLTPRVVMMQSRQNHFEECPLA